MLRIREASVADRPYLEQLVRLAGQTEPWHRQLESNGHPPGLCFVADTGHTLIAVGGLQPCGDAHGLLHCLFVRPGFRKQRLGRRLYQELTDRACALGLDSLYAMTASGRDYLESLGFSPMPMQEAPHAVRDSIARELHIGHHDPDSLTLLHRPLAPSSVAAQAGNRVATAAMAHFDSGYYCAESVLLAVADAAGLTAPWIPRIATGFCTGMGRSYATCGALNGGILALNLVLGRDRPGESVARNYEAVRALTEGFRRHCGSTQCCELLGCDLESPEGREAYREAGLRAQCRETVGTGARLAAEILRQATED